MEIVFYQFVPFWTETLQFRIRLTAPLREVWSEAALFAGLSGLLALLQDGKEVLTCLYQAGKLFEMRVTFLKGSYLYSPKEVATLHVSNDCQNDGIVSK